MNRTPVVVVDRDAKPFRTEKRVALIERAISKIKTLLRKCGARSLTALYFAIGEALGRITSRNATAYIKKAGYAATIK